MCVYIKLHASITVQFYVNTFRVKMYILVGNNKPNSLNSDVTYDLVDWKLATE